MQSERIGRRRPSSARPFCTVLVGALLALQTHGAHAFTVTLGVWSGTGQQVYLQVGVGSFTGLYGSGGTPQNNPTVNVVSVTVPVGTVGSGIAQPMTSNTGATNSFYDGASMCNAGQLYIGAYYRRDNNANVDATLSASPSGPLTNALGNTIPLSQISWTISGNRSGGPDYITAGSFTGGVQTIAAIDRNRWTEICLNFSYANTVTPSPGAYTARVTYTLTAPP